MGKVGLIGLGLLGSAIAERLLKSGSQLVGFDVSETQREAFQQRGGEVAASSAAVAARCDTLLLSLPDSRVVREVIDSVADSLRSGMRIIDTSTGDPEQAVSLSESLQRRDVEYLDATILGSSVQTREGQAIVMVGASDAAFAASRELLAIFAREVFHVGPPGSGSRMKLVVNLVLGLNRAALAEGLTLAKQLKLNGSATLAILKSGAAYSAVMDTKGPKMLAGDFSPQARLSQHLKDVRLILEAAARTGQSLPLSDAHRQLLEKAVAAGYGDMDNCAILKAYDAT